METTNKKNLATFTHLSTLKQYFIPFGNYIFPILIWTSKKKDSEFVDYHGKQALNFQLSLLLYSLVLAIIAIPIFIIAIFKNIPLKAIINEEDLFIQPFEYRKHKWNCNCCPNGGYYFCWNENSGILPDYLRFPKSVKRRKI